MEDELGLNDITGEDDIDDENSDDLSDIEPVPNTATSRVEEPEFEETPIEEPENNEEGASEETPRRSGGRRLANLRNRETASKEIPNGNRLAESKLTEDIKDETAQAAKYIALEIQERGIMNFEEIDEMAADQLGITVEKLRDEQLDTDIYISLNYEGIDNNMSTGDFYTQEYAEEHPEVLEESKLIEAPTEESDEFKKLCAEIEFQADENDFTLTKEDIKGIAKKMVADKFFFNHDIFTDENDEEAWGEINDLIVSAIEAYPNKLNETKELKENDDMEELNRLQDELRGVDVSKLSDEEYEEFKIKSDRVHELVNKLYDFHKLGESKTIIDNGDEIYTIDKNAKTYTIKTPKGEKTFTFDEMNEFVNRGKGMNRIYKPMSVLAYTDFKNGNLNKWNTRVED